MVDLFQMLENLKKQMMEKEITLSYYEKYKMDIIQFEQNSYINLLIDWSDFIYNLSLKDLMFECSNHLKNFYYKLEEDIDVLKEVYLKLCLDYKSLLSYIVSLSQVSLADFNTLLYLQGLDYKIKAQNEQLVLCPKRKSQDYFYLYVLKDSKITLFSKVNDELEVSPFYVHLFDQDMINFLYYYINYQYNFHNFSEGLLDIYYKYQSSKTDQEFIKK